LEALLEKEMLAEEVPLDCGANVTVNGTLVPGGIVTGRVIPPTLKTELLELAADTVTLEPLALRVPF
jgi:hypothetical protein